MGLEYNDKLSHSFIVSKKLFFYKGGFLF